MGQIWLEACTAYSLTTVVELMWDAPPPVARGASAWTGVLVVVELMISTPLQAAKADRQAARNAADAVSCASLDMPGNRGSSTQSSWAFGAKQRLWMPEPNVGPFTTAAHDPSTHKNADGEQSKVRSRRTVRDRIRMWRGNELEAQEPLRLRHVGEAPG